MTSTAKTGKKLKGNWFISGMIATPSKMNELSTGNSMPYGLWLMMVMMMTSKSNTGLHWLWLETCFCCLLMKLYLHFRLKKLLKVKCSERRYCKTCSSLLMPEDDGHNEHCVIMPVSDNQLRSPTQLLPLLSNNKTNAVSWFFLLKNKSIIRVFDVGLSQAT